MERLACPKTSLIDLTFVPFFNSVTCTSLIVLYIQILVYSYYKLLHYPPPPPMICTYIIVNF